jgi:hypothetical protein
LARVFVLFPIPGPRPATTSVGWCSRRRRRTSRACSPSEAGCASPRTWRPTPTGRWPS